MIAGDPLHLWSFDMDLGVPILVLTLAGKVGCLPSLQDRICQMGIIERENWNKEKATTERQYF